MALDSTPVVPTLIPPPLDPPDLYTYTPAQTVQVLGNPGYGSGLSLRSITGMDWYIVSLVPAYGVQTPYPGADATNTFSGYLTVLASRDHPQGITVVLDTTTVMDGFGTTGFARATVTIPPHTFNNNLLTPPYFVYVPLVEYYGYGYNHDQSNFYDNLFNPFGIVPPPPFPPPPPPPTVYLGSAQMVSVPSRQSEIINVPIGGDNYPPQALQLLSSPNAWRGYNTFTIPSSTASGFIASPSMIVSRRSNVRTAFYSDGTAIYRVNSSGAGDHGDWGGVVPVQNGHHPYVVQHNYQGTDVLYMACSAPQDKLVGCSFFESLDGGTTWGYLSTPLLPYNPFAFGRPVCVALGNTVVLVYGGATGAYCAYSTNNGRGWLAASTAVTSTLGNTQNFGIVAHHGTIYVAIRAQGVNGQGGYVNVSKSEDVGNHWTPVGQLPAAAFNDVCSLGVEEHTGRLYFGTSWNSVDGGVNWAANS